MGIKVIGAGYGRTGTSSFKKAMEILGFGKCYHMTEVIDNCHSPDWVKISNKEDPNLLRDLMEKTECNSTSDMPACVYWHELLLLYPDAKVVLTYRESEKWYKSWMDTIAYTMPDSEACPFGMRVLTGLGWFGFRDFGNMLHKTITRDAFNGDWSKKSMIQSYEKHIKNVELLCPPTKLLIFQASDGWEPLCKFLGVPIPNVPYPNINDTKEFQRMSTALNILGWILCILGCGIPAAYRTKSAISDEKKRSSNRV